MARQREAREGQMPRARLLKIKSPYKHIVGLNINGRLSIEREIALCNNARKIRKLN